jgi:hypothetical protein
MAQREYSDDMHTTKEGALLKLGDDSATMIGEIAVHLHMNQPRELSCELPAGRHWDSSQPASEDYGVDGNTVHFQSLEARNRVVAAHMFREKRSALAGNEAEWLGVAEELWHREMDQNDTAAGRLLATLHQTRDIFDLASDAISGRPQRVFDVLQLVELSLPYLGELPPEGILRLCRAQYEPTKNDLGAGSLFIKLEDVLTKQPDACRSLHSSVRNNPEDATAYLHQTTLVALARSQPEEAARLACEDTESTNDLLKSIALHTLGRLLPLSLVSNNSMPRVSAILITNISSATELVRKTAIRAAALAAPATDAFDRCLTGLGERGDQCALSAIAETLFLNTSALKGEPHFNDWVRLLCKLSPSRGAALGHFDHLLRRMIDDESQRELAISCLSEWVGINDSQGNESLADLFGSATSELAKRELLSQVVTSWLLSDNQRLPLAAAGLLSHFGVRGLSNPIFSIAILDGLEYEDLFFLARRLVGFVFSEDHLLSLALSFLKTREPQRAFRFLRSILVDELGYDYPSSTLEALESAEAAATEPELRAFLSSAVKDIRDRVSRLDALPRLAELSAPLMLQRVFARARSKQMRQIMEESQKGFLFLQMATQIPLKAGVGFFSFQDGGYTRTTPMKLHSQSVSIPRRQMLDTVGYEMTLSLLRTAKREKQ